MANLAGTVNLQVSLTDTLPVGATRLTAYPVPAKPADASIAYSNGTGANQGQKFYMTSQTATAAVVDTDLTAVVCSDGTTGFTNFRELVIYNDHATANLTFGLGTNPVTSLFMGGTTPTLIIAPGGVFRHTVPLGANGLVISGTAKVARVDPGAATVPFRMIVVGN